MSTTDVIAIVVGIIFLGPFVAGAIYFPFALAYDWWRDQRVFRYLLTIRCEHCGGAWPCYPCGRVVDPILTWPEEDVRRWKRLQFRIDDKIRIHLSSRTRLASAASGSTNRRRRDARRESLSS
jgi:hypothetical protein